MAAKEQLKWEGKLTAMLIGPSAEQVWPLLEDFCSLHKWLPSIDTCYHVEGVNSQPGLIRYCASTVPSPFGNTKMVNWCKERLLAIDPINKSFSYEVLDNNIGMRSYVANIKVLPCDEEEEEKHGSQIEWSFTADPIDGLTCEAFCEYIDSSLQGMMENMEKALQTT